MSPRMMLRLYKSAVTLAAPFLALWLATNKRRRPLLARFRPDLPDFDTAPIWVHACSVGELNTACPIIKALNTRWPQTPCLLTVSTPTAMALAKELDLPASVTWFPFDAPFVVRPFLRRLRPKVVLRQSWNLGCIHPVHELHQLVLRRILGPHAGQFVAESQRLFGHPQALQ